MRQSFSLILKLHVLRRGFAALISVFLVLAAVPAVAAEQKGRKSKTTAEPASVETRESAPEPAAKTPSLPPAAAPSGPAAIPVADVATQAAEVANQIETITQKLAPSHEVEMIRQSLPDIRRQIDQELAETVGILQGQPALPTLEAQQDQWQQTQSKTRGWLAVLTKYSNALQGGA